jgi:hypothetical protein
MSLRALDLFHDPQIHIILPDVKLSTYSFHNLSSIEHVFYMPWFTMYHRNSKLICETKCILISFSILVVS